MRRFVKLILVTIFMMGMLTGCDSCFDDAVTNKVDAPNFIIKRGTNYNIEITSDTPRAKIKYTIDGTDPKDSDTAVVGTELTIDIFTTIKAYAYREGKRESETLSFSLPRFGTGRKVTYNLDFTVKDYVYTANDCNDLEKLVVHYNGKGNDDQWFTWEDDVEYYVLHKYTDNKLEETIRYNGAGADGNWLTSDDDIEYYSEYNYNGDSIESETFKDSGDTEIGSGTYTYTDGKLTQIDYDINGTKSSKTYDAATGNLTSYTDENGETVTCNYENTDDPNEMTSAENATSAWKIAYQDEDVQEYFYEYETDANGNITKKVKKLGYGADTNWGFVSMTYDENGNMITATKYWDNAGEKERLFYEYTYEGSNLKTRYKYKSSAKEYLRYWAEYTYDESNRVTLEDLYNREAEKERYSTYEYAGDTSALVTTYERPAVASKEVELHIWLKGTSDGFEYVSERPSEELDVTFKANEKEYSYLLIGGYEYNEDGDPLNEIVDIPSDQKEFAKTIRKKVTDIVENTDWTENSIIINGVEGGTAQAMIATRENMVNLVLDFDNYNDGDVLIDGELDLEFANVSIDVSGALSGSFDGYFDGSIYVADANPNFADTDYTIVAVTSQEIVNGNVVREIEYKAPGADGDWTTLEDNTIKYVRIFTYDAENRVTFKSQHKGVGSNGDWDSQTADITAWTEDLDEALDDRLDYRIIYDYAATADSGRIYNERVERDYGSYGKTDTGTPNETLDFYLHWRYLWDIDNYYEIDWNDDYWNYQNEELADEDKYQWSVE